MTNQKKPKGIPLVWGKYVALFMVCFGMCLLDAGCSPMNTPDFRDVMTACRNRTRKQQAICRGMDWLFKNPVDIHREGFMELGEEINLFYMFYLNAGSAGEKEFYRSAIRSRIERLLREHDLRVNHFEEILGYLYFVHIMNRMGISNERYEDFVETEVLPNGMMHHGQSNTFMLLSSAMIEGLGRSPQVPFQRLLDQGIIARLSPRPDLVPIDKVYVTSADIQNFYYDVTHEIFAMSNYGERDPSTCLLDHELQFLKGIIPRGMARFVEEGEVDIVAELIVCARMIGCTDFHGFEDAVLFILDAQKDDGSFGPIRRMSFLGRPNIYRHGVLVALWALVE
ncbi:MAG: DUF6895 family protein [bacterium]